MVKIISTLRVNINFFCVFAIKEKIGSKKKVSDLIAAFSDYVYFYHYK